MSGATTLSILAKEPRPGRVKTRLHAGFSPQEAADLAVAAIEDTVAAVLATPATRRVIVWDGPDPGWRDRFAAAGLTVLDQRPGTLNDRLTGAFADRARPGERHLLVGMDTPQLSPAVLAADWAGADAVLGLCPDGGFWAIGLRDIDPVACFADIPMSTDKTGAAQLDRLHELGCTVMLLPPLRDIDEPPDAAAVAGGYPDLRFSARHRRITGTGPTQPADRLFDLAYAGVPLQVDCPDEPLLDLDLDRWAGPASAVDALVVTRCEPPVLDLGCGPGRLVRALTESGRPSLGVDSSAAAVASSRRQGAPALRAAVEDPLPAEGRWGTVVLLDGNIGIGGDVSALLERCRQLTVPGGLVLIEVDPDDRPERSAWLRLRSEQVTSDPVPWSSIGATALVAAAADAGLVAAEQWSAGGRAFVALRRTR